MAAFDSNASSVFARRAAAAVRFAVLTLAGAAALAGAQSACAALGGAPMATPAGASVSTPDTGAAVSASVSTAQTTAKSAVQASAAQPASASTAYTVRQTTLATGTIVREYVSPAGTVFAVGWSGPQPPDLSALLGTYFPQYVAGVQARRAAGAARGPGIVETSGLVVHSGGHMGAFSGQAWLPQALPAGVSASDIQ